MPRVPDYRPAGVVSTLLPDQAQPQGGRALTAIGERIDQYLASRYQTDVEVARQEGTAAGRIAGEADPAAQNPANTIYARAFNAGATEIAVRRAEISTRQHLDEIFNANQNDPNAVRTLAAQYRDGLATNLPPDRAALVRAAVDLHAQPYVNQAARNAERLVAQGRVTTADTVLDDTIISITRNAGAAAGGDQAAEAALQTDLASGVATIVRLGPRDAFELNGVRYPADPTRAGALTIDQMRERTRRLHDVATTETALAYFRARPAEVSADQWIADFARGSRARGDFRPELLDHIISRATAEGNRAQAAARGEVAAGLQDDMGAVAATGRGAGANGTFRISDAQIRAAWPGAEGEQRVEARRAAQRAYQYRQELRDSTPAQRDAREQQLEQEVTAGAENPLDRPGGIAPTGRVPTRENNWGNIRVRGSAEFRTFGTAEEGVAAMVRQLDNYARRGIVTPRQILSTYAPRADNNDPDNYARIVQREAGLDPDQPVNLQDRNTLRALITAMVHVEQGRYPPDHEQVIARGIAQVRDSAAPPGTTERAQALDLYRRERRAFEQQLNEHGSDMALAVPAIAQRFEAWQAQLRSAPDQAPATLQAAMRAAMDWQRNAGVREESIAPLPSTMVQSIAARFAGATTDRERLQILQSVAEVPDADMRQRVQAQLAGAGPQGNRIPAAAGLVLEIARDPARRSIAERVLGELTAAGRDVPDIPQGQHTNVVRAVDAAFASAIGDVLARQAAATGSAQIEARATALKAALMQVVRIRGAATGDYAGAADEAAADMFGHRLTIDHSGVRVHFPSSAGTPAQIETGLTLMRERVPDLLAGMAPPTTGAGGPVAQRQWQRFVRDVRENGVWVNAGEGFALAYTATRPDPVTGREVAVRALLADPATGRPWIVSPADAVARAAAAPTPDPNPFGLVP